MSNDVTRLSGSVSGTSGFAAPSSGTSSSSGEVPTGNPSQERRASQGEAIATRYMGQSELGQAGISENLTSSIGDRFRSSFMGMETGAMIGTVLAILAGAAGTFWLGGKSVLLGAAGGLVTACGLPFIIPLISRIGGQLPSQALDRSAEEAAVKSRGRERSKETFVEQVGAANHDAVDVLEGRLGSLSVLLPRTKGAAEKQHH